MINYLKIFLSVILALTMSEPQAGLDYDPNLPYGHVATVSDSLKRALDANRIRAEYVESLGLAGKSGWDLLKMMTGEGFRCEIDAADNQFAKNMKLAPAIGCSKNFSNISEFCSNFLVDFEVDWLQITTSRTSLYKQLENAAIKSVSGGICIYSPELENGYYLHRYRANAQLKHYMQNLHLDGMNGKDAFGKLLIEGFSCGIQNKQDSNVAAQINCSMVRSKVDWCYKANIEMTLNWDARLGKAGLHELQSAKVVGVKSECLMGSQ